jgi:3-isopropylmalate dehydrogenase
MIESSRMLVEWLGHDREIPAAVAAARLMKRAIDLAMADPSSRTPDIRGTARTEEVTAAIVDAIARGGQ